MLAGKGLEIVGNDYGVGFMFGLPSVGPVLFARGEAETMPAAARAMMDWENFMIR